MFGQHIQISSLHGIFRPVSHTTYFPHTCEEYHGLMTTIDRSRDLQGWANLPELNNEGGMELEHFYSVESKAH
jgi:hypothetical protein